jgi:hypothetical protein
VARGVGWSRDVEARNDGMNERVRARVQRALAEELDPGERIELALFAHTGPMFYDPILSLFNMVNVARGKTQGRALILTDRRVLYARANVVSSIKEVIHAWPRGSAPVTLSQERGRGHLTVDGEKCSFRGLAGVASELVRLGGR